MSSPLEFAKNFFNDLINANIKEPVYETNYPVYPKSLGSGKNAENSPCVTKKGDYPDNHIGKTGCNN
jgi:hypothetical protein